ncbi:MAG: type II secretion system protein [Verrucomicrobiales bacterium]
MKTHNTSTAQRRQAGFSLVELLVTIVVLGIFSMIAVSLVSANYDKVNANKAKQDAQSLAMIASGAQMAGVDFEGWTRERSSISSGRASQVRAFSPVQSLQYTDFSDSELELAMQFLEWDGRELIYNPTGE